MLITIERLENGFMVTAPQDDYMGLDQPRYVFTTAKTCVNFVSKALAKAPKRVVKEKRVKVAIKRKRTNA